MVNRRLLYTFLFNILKMYLYTGHFFLHFRIRDYDKKEAKFIYGKNVFFIFNSKPFIDLFIHRTSNKFQALKSRE